MTEPVTITATRRFPCCIATATPDRSRCDGGARTRRRRRDRGGDGGRRDRRETDVSQAVGLSVTVRKDIVETIAYNRDKGIGVTVYVGSARPREQRRFLRRRHTRHRRQGAGDRPAHGAGPLRRTRDPDRLARDIPDLDLYHPWNLTVEDAIALGRETEAAALAVDPRLTNTEGSTVSRGEAEFVYANSLGFLGGYRNSRHHIDCAVIGKDEGGMQRDFWYTAARAQEDLQAPGVVGRIAGERTARRLNARRLARWSARCCSRRRKQPT